MDKLQTYAQAIYTFYNKQGRMPSYAEAAQLFGFKSKDSAFLTIKKLIALGSIKKDKTGKLIPVSKTVSPIQHLKLVGLIEAGFPSPAEESLLDTISLDEWLIPKREGSFMLKVKGESMKDAGICDGDMIIAERANDAKVGTIVVAELDGEWTLKTLRKDTKGMYLEPANPDFPSKMRPKHSLKIAAIVRGVVRKY